MTAAKAAETKRVSSTDMDAAALAIFGCPAPSSFATLHTPIINSILLAKIACLGMVLPCQRATAEMRIASGTKLTEIFCLRTVMTEKAVHTTR